MGRPFRILALSGSARTDSTNERLLKRFAVDHAADLSIEIYGSLAALPIFTPDLDGEQCPLIIRELRDKIAHADGILICTPEYVFSPPAAIKNVLEWMVSVTVLSDKPAALIVAATGGEKTMESLTLILNTLGVVTTEATRVLICGARSKVAATGIISDDKTAASVSNCFADFKRLMAKG